MTTVLDRMTERFLQLDDILRKEADNDQTLQGMGTTLTVAGALGSDLIIGHVGDSRAYLLHGDNLTPFKHPVNLGDIPMFHCVECHPKS